MKCLVAVLAGAALAGSALGYYIRPENADCLTVDEAKQQVDIYAKLIANYTNEDCEKYCSDDFSDWSDSINTFLNQTIGGPTFATKQIFMDAQTNNPPFPLIVESVDAIDCNVIALQWTATFGVANQTSKGITTLINTKAKGYWQISRINVEFNSLNWLLDMGGSYIWEG